MDAKRVKVLHVTDGDAVIRRVPHHFVLNLLPAEKRLLDEQLRRVRQRLRARGERKVASQRGNISFYASEDDRTVDMLCQPCLLLCL